MPTTTIFIQECKRNDEFNKEQVAQTLDLQPNDILKLAIIPTTDDDAITWSLWAIVNQSEWITLPAASHRFNVPLPTLRYHAVRGHFEAHKPDKRTWLCEAGSVEEWVEERRK